MRQHIFSLIVLVLMSLVGTSVELRTQHGFGSVSDIDDTEHMRHHLGSKIDVEALNEQKRRFHYFKLHDLNHDGALDGLEIIKAVTHDHHNPDEKPREAMSDTQIENLVDIVMKDMDIDLNGKISFSEYLRKQGV